MCHSATGGNRVSGSFRSGRINKLHLPSTGNKVHKNRSRTPALRRYHSIRAQRLRVAVGRRSSSWCGLSAYAVYQVSIISCVPHSHTSDFVFPQIIHLVLSSSLNSPALREIERHLLRSIKTVQNHENNTIARVPRPVLSRMRGIVHVIIVDAPSERRETLANDRVLVDLDDVSVP
jgi:hypothetical protein